MAFEKYQILELESDASPEQIKRAYVRLIRLHSPEKDPETFKLIRSAYEVLKDPKTRQAYDTLELHGAQLVELALEGDKLMSEGAWDRAASRWKHMLVLLPREQEVWNKLGLCQLHLRRHEQATKTYAALMKQCPEVALYWHNRGAAYHEWASDEDDKRKLLNKARFCYRRAAQLEQFNPNHCLAISRTYADEQRLDRALAWAEKAAGCRRDEPEDIDSLFWMCVLRIREGDLGEIPELAQRIRTALPKSIEAKKYAAARFASLAIELHRLGEFQRAAVLYDAAKGFDPGPEIVELPDNSEAAAQILVCSIVDAIIETRRRELPTPPEKRRRPRKPDRKEPTPHIICWFCSAREGAADSVYTLRMHKIVNETVGQLRWTPMSVEIPRCEHCADGHQETRMLGCSLSLLGGVAGVVATLVMMGINGLSILCSIGLGAGLMILAGGLGAVLSRSTIRSDQGTKPRSYAQQHPLVAKYVQDGFRFGEKPAGA